MPVLAYYFSGFPALSETLARSQVLATGELGLPYLLLANRPPGRMHPGDRGLAARTVYLNQVSVAAYLQAMLRKIRQAPAVCALALRQALRWSRGLASQVAANLFHLAGAAYLAEFCKRRHICQVHVHYAFGAAEMALWQHLLGGPPYSLSIHGSDVLFGSPLLEAVLKGAAFVVSNCEYHIHHVRERFPALSGQRFFLVRGGLNFRDGLWARWVPPAPPPPLRLLHVGRLAPVKAQEVLLLACARLHRQGVPVACRIAGDGPEAPRLKRLCQELGLGDQVSFLGARPETEVAPLYDWCQVLVLSSRSEGTPMVVLEAMAKGRPVVAPRITALPEMVQDGVTGFLFRPGEAEELAQTLAKFFHQPELIPQMGHAGRERARKLFDLPTNARLLVDIFAREIPALGLTPTRMVPYV